MCNPIIYIYFWLKNIIKNDFFLEKFTRRIPVIKDLDVNFDTWLSFDNRTGIIIKRKTFQKLGLFKQQVFKTSLTFKFVTKYFDKYIGTIQFTRSYSIKKLEPVIFMKGPWSMDSGIYQANKVARDEIVRQCDTSRVTRRHFRGEKNGRQKMT